MTLFLTFWFCSDKKLEHFQHVWDKGKKSDKNHLSSSFIGFLPKVIKRCTQSDKNGDKKICPCRNTLFRLYPISQFTIEVNLRLDFIGDPTQLQRILPFPQCVRTSLSHVVRLVKNISTVSESTLETKSNYRSMGTKKMCHQPGSNQ